MKKAPSAETVALMQRALALHRAGDLALARECLEAIVAVEPRDFFALNFLGLVALQRGEPAAAIGVLRRAIAADPLNEGIVGAYLNLGAALYECGDWVGAIAALDRVLARRADDIRALANKAAALARLGRLEDARACLERAIALGPNDAKAHANLGSVQLELGAPAAARLSLSRAIELQPTLVEAYLSRASAALVLGDLEAGWTDFEWRLKTRPYAITAPMPRWHAPATLAGRRILLRAEQGLGDALQFIRYAPLVAARGAHVVVEVAPALAGLVARVDGVAAVSTWGDPPPAADYQCPLMSLPYEFGTTLATVPGTVPYLRADEQRCAHWRARLSAERRPKVGLVWSGGLHRNQPDCAASSARRNIALAELAALRHPGIAYYSLQKGAEAEAELATAVAAGWSGPPMTDFTTELRDFDDTAALVENLDLVISVDTSTAHLAGALGKPVWVLNRHDTCWRWLLDRTDSPWYPTLRLFRQPRRQDWGAVVDSVRTALHQWLSRPPA